MERLEQEAQYSPFYDWGNGTESVNASNPGSDNWSAAGFNISEVWH